MKSSPRFQLLTLIMTALVIVTGAYLFVGISTSCKPSQTPEADVTQTTPDAARESATPSFDAADGCSSACANLGALGCSDGADFTACVAACQHVEAARLTKIDTACLMSAHSRAAAIACGGVSCE